MTYKNKKRLLNLNFWISEIAILGLSNYYRWMEKWNLIGVLISVLILVISVQYCILHVKELRKHSVSWYYIILIELSYLLSNLYLVLGNMFWFSHSHEINFVFLIGLAILLCPMAIVNGKMLKK